MLLKESPYAFAVVVVAPQPVLPLSWLQLECCRFVPYCEPAVLMLHPADVWRVMVFEPARFTPSMMSISPLLGHLIMYSQ